MKAKLKIWVAGLLLVFGFLCVLGSVGVLDCVGVNESTGPNDFTLRIFLGFGMMFLGSSMAMRLIKE